MSKDSRLTINQTTADEFKSGGAGMEIAWGISDSPFGKCFLAETPRGISHLSFFDNDQTDSLAALAVDWPKAALKRDDRFAASANQSIFQTNSKIRLHLKGTEFQIRVWRALLEIPSGELSTYSQLAESIGMPGSARAVGNAVGRNRISYLIPCHRIIRKNGELGGYRWGTERKRAMLSQEH